MTIEELEEQAFLSRRTISRLRTEERRDYSLDQVIAICVALHLPPWLSREMIQRAGFILRPTKQHLAYQFILDCLFMDSVSDVQNFLVESGCQQLRLSSLNFSASFDATSIARGKLKIIRDFRHMHCLGA